MKSIKLLQGIAPPVILRGETSKNGHSIGWQYSVDRILQKEFKTTNYIVLGDV